MDHTIVEFFQTLTVGGVLKIVGVLVAGVVAFWILSSIAGVLWFRHASKKMDEDFHRKFHRRP